MVALQVNCISYSVLSTGDNKFRGSLMFGGIISSTLFSLSSSMSSGSSLFVSDSFYKSKHKGDSNVSRPKIISVLTCSELRFRGSEMLPPSRNFGMRVLRRALFSGRKNFETPVTLKLVGRVRFTLWTLFFKADFSFSCLLILISRFSTSIIAFIGDEM